jgi:hypothetical protein
MPLTPVGPRRELHTRRITCQGFEREDGLWDIEAHLVDTRGYTYTTPERGEMRPGMAGHDMWLRWTIGRDMVIRAIEVVSDATPYPSSCPKAAVSYQKLVGLNVGKGFLKAAQERIGRDESCTHLHTLIQAAANSSMQTIAGSLWEGNSGGAKTDKLFGGVQGSESRPCWAVAEPISRTIRSWPECGQRTTPAPALAASDRRSVIQHVENAITPTGSGA